MPFDLQPVLHGDRARLRPLRPDDWDALYDAAADPLIWEQYPAPIATRKPLAPHL